MHASTQVEEYKFSWLININGTDLPSGQERSATEFLAPPIGVTTLEILKMTVKLQTLHAHVAKIGSSALPEVRTSTTALLSQHRCIFLLVHTGP